MECHSDSQATTQLNTQFYKNATCIPALYEIAATSQNQAVSPESIAGLWLIARLDNLLPSSSEREYRTEMVECGRRLTSLSEHRSKKLSWAD